MNRSPIMLLRVLLTLILLLLAGGVQAAEFFVDPAAAAAGNGSAASPWQTLEKVVTDGHFGKEIKAGDTVWLLGGYHGELVVKGGSYAPAITVAARAGAMAKLRRAAFSGTRGWVLSGVSISPSHAPTYQKATLVSVDRASSEVVVEDCRIFSVEDATAWSAAQWINDASNGIDISGDHVTASNNVIRNVRFGISASGPNDVIEYNQVVNFSADGMRGLGDNEVFQYNLVKNVFVDDTAGDANHDDGFQSWSVGPGGVGTGEVKGIVLRGNLILNREDANQPLQSSMQGIGCFDGFFTGWVVENNVVVTDHWHGITFLGMRDSRIVNNTVIDAKAGQPGPPWIMVNPHKDGRTSTNVIVRNNLATDFDLKGTAVTDDHNTTLTDLTKFFVKPAAFDLHLLETAPAVDTGSADLAPALDFDRIARPQGAGIDQGAYEWHEPGVTPVDGGTGTEAGSAANDAGAEADAAASGDGAPTERGAADGDSGAVKPAATGSGCSCRLTSSGAHPGWSVLAGLLLAGLARRRLRH